MINSSKKQHAPGAYGQDHTLTKVPEASFGIASRQAAQLGVILVLLRSSSHGFLSACEGLCRMMKLPQLLLLQDQLRSLQVSVVRLPTKQSSPKDHRAEVVRPSSHQGQQAAVEWLVSPPGQQAEAVRPPSHQGQPAEVEWLLSPRGPQAEAVQSVSRQRGHRAEVVSPSSH